MNTQRFNHLFSLAKSAKQSLDARGFLQRNKLPRVTPAEHAWLTKHHPTMARFTRLFEYDPKEYIEDVNRAASAQRPRVTEIWVGARSLSCIPGESAEHESEGLSASQMEQEDAAETTMMQTMLYHDADSGQPMIEDDETGELRPVRIGDIVQVVPSKQMVSHRLHWKTKKPLIHMSGLTDDLDQLFLEEGDDPRHQEDMSAYGSDHKWSDRFSANSLLEEEFLSGASKPRRSPVSASDLDRQHDARMGKIGKQDATRGLVINNDRYVIANSAPSMEDYRPQPDEMAIRRSAQMIAIRMIEKKPEWKHRLLELTDQAADYLMSEYRDVRYDDEGAMVDGCFLAKADYFEAVDRNKALLDKAVKGPKRAPSKVDWDKVRDHPDHVAEIRRRKLEAERNRMKAQLVIR